MNARISLALFGALLVVASGCRAPQSGGLSHGDVMRRFSARASAEELHRLDQLRAANDRRSRERALEVVLSKLTREELRQVGVYEAKVEPESSPREWAVGQFPTSGRAQGVESELTSILCRAGVAYTVAGMIAGTIYVPKEQYFLARRVLLSSKDRQVRECVWAAPQFSLE